MSITRFHAAAFAALASATLVTGAAHAAMADVVVTSVPTRMVSTRGIDLKTADGVARAEGLIRVAASKVCPQNGNHVDDWMQASKCRATAVEGAKPQLAQLIARANSGEALASATVAVRAAP